MFVLIWSTLFFSVRGSSADKVTSVWGRQHCRGKGYCVTLSERELTAEAGLCVVIPCSFTTAANFTPKHIVWYKCEASKKCSDADITFHSNKKKKKVQSGFEGRVSSLESDASQKNCSIIINDLKVSDSGSYQLKVTGEWNGKKNASSINPRVNVSVKGLKQKPTVMIPTLTEGQQATLTCTAPGLCSGSAPQITWTWRGAGGTESYITGNSTDFKTENLTDVTQRHVSTLTFNPSAEQHNTNVTCKIHFTGETTTEKTAGLNVNYVKEVYITGVTTVRDGEALNLTCNVHSFPPSLIIWSKLGYNETLHIDTGSANLVITNVTAGDARQYVCTAKYMNNTLKDKVNVTVIWFSKIQKGSGCVLQSEVLTCVCISEGFPLPTINWPLLKNHTEYSVITTVSNHTVNSTISLTVKSHGNSTVECVSNNGNGEEREILLIHQNLSEKHEQSSGVRLAYLKVTIAFLTGVLFSAVLCCLAKHCYRNKQKTSRSLEMRTHQDDKLVYDGQELQDNLTLNSNSGPKEVEYADINFSLLKRNGAREAARRQESTKTVYAEVKKAVEEREDDAEEEGEMLEAKEDEMVVEMEMKYCEPEKELEMGKERVYATVNDVTDEI
ncbi:sialic acid-binding Ig-like lectin 5 isoform X2 [Pundamilia nyererei]|uniref:Sialic acid-binding Ig-like lectin 5 isoform X2 n=1 Tax=Pundamilia nyererei TaxID=303518 RepID=A0A9Y3RVJ4_9CICH|nr:PREDICTED: sialic acid-binding Ig-like lectin 5 isoform X2 [Pundamilia nyererei]